MPGCVLHVTGEDFDVESFLTESDLQPYRVHHRGEIRLRDQISPTSGLSLNVSNADGELAVEVTDATRFLKDHEAELRRLREFPGVTNLCLDFGHYHRGEAAKFDYLPPELLARAGNLGIGIELSLYSTLKSDVIPD